MLCDTKAKADQGQLEALAFPKSGLSRCTTLSPDGAACLTIARICSFNFFVCSFVRACLSGMDWAAAYVMGKEQP